MNLLILAFSIQIFFCLTSNEIKTINMVGKNTFNANVVPIHKKGDKQILKNYRPISLLPITGKILERLLYDTMSEFFTKNNLISDNQSGFKPGNLCVNQLFSITYEIYQSLMIILKSELFFRHI